MAPMFGGASNPIELISPRLQMSLAIVCRYRILVRCRAESVAENPLDVESRASRVQPR